MRSKLLHTILLYCIAFIWLTNGLFCKVLNLVPRHQQIVSKILGDDYSRLLTVLIGCSEILMAIWIITRIKQRWNIVVQLLIISTMNILEFFLAPELLLWGHFNILFAGILVFTIFYNEFYIQPQT